MFKYYREMRELKISEKRLKVILLGKLFNLTQMFNGGSELLELANKLKDVDEKEIVSALVDAIKTNEKSE